MADAATARSDTALRTEELRPFQSAFADTRIAAVSRFLARRRADAEVR